MFFARMGYMKELFFWLHILIIIFAVSTPFLFSLPVVVSLVVLHRAHVLFWGGCAFSRLQKSLALLPQEKDFIQSASERLFRREITRQQSRVVDYFLVSLTLGLSVVRLLPARLMS